MKSNTEFKFHLSLPALDIRETKRFYLDKLGCESGRRGTNWIDINLFGNQITFSACGEFNFDYKNYAFENKVLPSFHFGVLLDRKTWENLYESVKPESLMWVSPSVFLEDKPGEHQSFFLEDPNGYILEFKSFTYTEDVFKSVNNIPSDSLPVGC